MKQERVRLGDVLIEAGYITPAHIESAILLQKEDRTKRLGEILIDMKVLTEEQLLIALGQRLHHDIIDLKNIRIELDVVAMVPQAISEKYIMLPIKQRGDCVIVAINDPMDFYAMEDVKSFIQDHVEFVLCKKEDLRNLIRQSYAEIESRKAANMAGDLLQVVTEESTVDVESSTEESESPVIKLMNTLILKAYSEGVSDVHIEPFDKFINVRFRIDGQLIHYMKLEKGLALQISTRIKILSELDSYDIWSMFIQT